MSEAVLNLGLETREFKRDLLRTERDLKLFNGIAKGVAFSIGAVLTSAIANSSWEMIKLGADAVETGNKFQAVFKGIESQSEIVSASFARDFDLADSTAQKLLSTTGDLLTGFGFTRGEALNLSYEVNKLAGDLNSFQNFSGGAEGASVALTKALLGETESAKALGIVVKQGTKEYKDNVKNIMALTGATEQQARTQAIWKQIVDQSKSAIGDYAKTSDSTANRIKKLEESWKDLSEKIGIFLIDALEVDSSLENIARGFNSLAGYINRVAFEFKEARNEASAFIAKTVVFLKAVPETAEISLKELFADEKEMKVLQRRLNVLRRDFKASFKGIDQASKEQTVENFKNWERIERKKLDLSKKNVKKQLEDAKRITEGTGISTPLTTDVKTKSDRSTGQEFSGAFLKGSTEAYSVEKKQTGNVTERKQLKVQEQIERNTRVSSSIIVNQLSIS